MLKLRENWQIIWSGAAVADLLAQVPGEELRTAAARHLVAASLELMVVTWPRKSRPRPRLETLNKTMWRLGDHHYMFLADNDDSALEMAIQLAWSSQATLILSPVYEGLKRQLLGAMLLHRSPSISSLDSFVYARTWSATLDKGWPHYRAVRELFLRFNQRVVTSGSDLFLIVDIPRESG